MQPHILLVFLFVSILSLTSFCGDVSSTSAYPSPSQSSTAFRNRKESVRFVPEGGWSRRLQEPAADEEEGFVAPTAPDEEEGFVAPTSPDEGNTGDGAGDGDGKGEGEGEGKGDKEGDDGEKWPAFDDPLTGEDAPPPPKTWDMLFNDFLHSYMFMFMVGVCVFGVGLFVYLRLFHPRAMTRPDDKAVYTQLSVFDPTEDDNLDEEELEDMH
jgi:hypothetical protein